MPEITKQNKEILEIASRKANDSDLFLLDKIHSIETDTESTKKDVSEIKDEILEIKTEFKKETPEDKRVEDIASRLAAKLSISAEDVRPTEEELLAIIKPLIPEVKDGKTPTKEEIVAIIKPLIPKAKDGKDADEEKILSILAGKIEEQIKNQVKEIDLPTELMKLSKIIRDSLETLKEDERLDKSAIKGLEELEKSINDLVSRVSTLEKRPTGAGRGKIPIIKRYRLTDQCNGTLKAFTLPIDTVDVLGVFGSQFPVQYDPNNDWTFSGRTLTLGDSVGAPEAGQTLWVLIEGLFY